MIETIILRNKKVGKEVLVDKDQSFYVLDEADLGTIEGSHQSSKYPEQIGETNTYSVLGTRPVSITGWVIGSTEEDIKAYKKTLNLMVNPLQDIDLIYDGFTLVFRPTCTIKYSVNYQENNEVLCKFLISGKCFNPLFEDEHETIIPVASDIAMFHFPLIFKEEEKMVFSYRSPSLMANVKNNGTASTGFTVIFEAEGEVINPKLVNVNTQEFILIEKTMEKGEVATVKTDSGNEKISGKIGQNDYNYFKYLSLDSSWIQLEVGDNILAYSADSGVDLLNVMVQYSNKYLEVQ